MAGPERLLPDFQAAPQKRLGPHVVARLNVPQPEVIEGLRGIGMVWPQSFLPNFQAALVKRHGPRVVAHGHVQ